jgi:hypothetical protein
MLATDEKTCKEIEDYVCKKPATEADEAYCECIGLGKRSTLLHSVIEKSVSNLDEDPNEANEIMAFSMPEPEPDDVSSIFESLCYLQMLSNTLSSITNTG